MSININIKYYGLYLGSSSVKLVEITLAGRQLSLTRVEERALPPGRGPLSEPEAGEVRKIVIFPS